MNYTVLSPWAHIDNTDGTELKPRIDDLNGKTIGLFAHFKQHSPMLLDVIREELQNRYPEACFTTLQYPRDTIEIQNDPDFDVELKRWLGGVDAVISALGDAGSCTLFLAYNTAYIEKLGKPTVLISNKNYVTTAKQGAKIRNVPALRIVSTDMGDLSMEPVLDTAAVDRLIRPTVAPILEAVIDGLTKPLTQEEAKWTAQEDVYSNAKFTGTLNEIDKLFYQNGWTNGIPIMPPTEEAVREMMTGTDLPSDFVVAKIPPRLGIATVEKIAINAVMAGCLPIHMPVLIAAVKGMVDHRIHLEGWTCSASSWFPLIILSGKITKELDMNSSSTALTPYRKASAAIARAFQLIIMNIGGTRPFKEDMSQMGHENRFGVCIAEDYDKSIWEPLHTNYGINASESAVTLFWPHDHSGLRANNVGGFLRSMCDVKAVGFAPGCAYVITPKAAKMIKDVGLSRKDVLDYISEYARRPATEGNLRWVKGNNHLPHGIHLPMDKSCNYRKFWNTDHLLIAVAGNDMRFEGVAFAGGGDHGGPSCTKIDLPKRWDDLIKSYADYTPKYIDY